MEVLKYTDEKSCKKGNVFVTLIGDLNVISANRFSLIKDGATVRNSGYFNNEIDLTALKKMSKSAKNIRDFVDEYTLKIVCSARNLATVEGHPASVMDVPFANQAISVVKNHKNLEKNVYVVPEGLDIKINKA
jgi:adenosylhomocysteinase